MDIQGNDFKKLSMLINERRALKSKLLELEINLLSEKMKNTCNTASDEKHALITKISAAKAEMLEIISVQNIQEVLLQSLQMSHATAECIFKQETEKDISDQKGYFTEMITKQNDLILKFTYHCEALQALNDQLEDLQNCCYELKQKKQEMLSKIQFYKRKLAEKEMEYESISTIKTMMSEINQRSKLIEILQQLFQKFVHSSQINWTNSDKLQTLMLDLGRKPAF